MQDYQMKKKYFIPIVALGLTSVFMLLFFLLPTSRYSLLTLDGSLSFDSPWLYVSIVSTVLEIVLFAILIVLCVLELFTTKLFVFRLELTFDLFLLLLALVSETVFLVSFPHVENPSNGLPHWISFVVLLVLCLLCLFLSIVFVYLPFFRIEKDAKCLAEKWQMIEEKQSDEKRKEIESQMSSIDSKEKMKAYLKTKFEDGELSKEKYTEFLSELDDKC